MLVLFHLPVVLEVVDDIADGRVGAVLQQAQLRAPTRPREVALEGRSASVEHAVRSPHAHAQVY